MMLDKFLQAVEDKGIKFSKDVPMCNHTSFKIGGNADVMLSPQNEQELQFVITAAHQNGVPIFCLGKGSNILVSDKGIEGGVVSLANMNGITVKGEKIICSAGCSLASVCNKAKENSLSGLEFAYGIPGSIGGALFMNAGAYGGEMSQVVRSARCMNENGEFCELSLEEMMLGYRDSVFKRNGFIITEVTLSLSAGDISEIAAKMDELMRRRLDKQPLEYPSAGSTFKRPEGYFAGALIEKNGLKGTSVGGAQVSEKHAGFIINKGSATACDVLSHIELIKNKVLSEDGVRLEPEVLFVGR